MLSWTSIQMLRIFTTVTLSMFMVACNKANMTEQTTSTATSSVIYPHTSDFKISNHGAVFLHDPSTCANCHSTLPSYGGISPSSRSLHSEANPSPPPACTQCHNYPHTPLWALPKNHGVTYANSLHAAPADVKPVGCTQCHDGIKEAQYQAAGLTSYPVACDSCHILMPHSKRFKEGRHFVEARTYQGGCVNCHNDLTAKYLPNQDGSGCYNCHDDGKIPTMKWLPIPAPSPTPSAVPPHRLSSLFE